MTGETTPTLRIYLLGRFAVEYAGKPVAQSAWKRRRPVELLTSLALAPGFLMHREEIIDRLWPDKDLDAGANNLYRTLHQVRRATGDDAVCVERGVVRLVEGAWTDVAAFHDAASSALPERLAEAAGLYRGDLLPDEPYSDRLQSRRESLRQRFVDAGMRLARHRAQSTSEADDLIDVLRRVLDSDPTLEEAHRMLMLCLAESGRNQDAIRQFSACQKALRDALDSRPAAETRDLYFRIRSGDVAVDAATTERHNNWPHLAKRLVGNDGPSTLR